MRILSCFSKITTLLIDRRGATAIEYALVASLISVAAVVSFDHLGDMVGKRFTMVDQSID